MSLKCVKIAANIIMLHYCALGLISYYYHNSGGKQRLKTSRLLILYSACVKLLAISFVCYRFYSDYYADLAQLFGKDTTKIHDFMIKLSCLITYLSVQYISKTLFDIFNNHMDFLSTMLESNNNKVAIGLTFAKLYITPIIAGMRIFLQPKKPSFADILYQMFPVCIEAALQCLVFSTIVIGTDLIRMSNERLRIMAHNMRNDTCTLNAIAYNYKLICTGLVDCFNLLAVPCMFSLMCTLIGIVAYAFQQYTCLADAIITGQLYDYSDAIASLAYFLTLLGDIQLWSKITQSNTDAIRNTGSILVNMPLQNADDLFKCTMEQFSCLILIIDYKLRPLGLYELRADLIYDCFNGVTVFLIILIQGDLAKRYALNV